MHEILFAVLFCGIPVSLGGMLAAAALLTMLDIPSAYYPAAAAVPVLGGCLVCAFCAGKRLRRGGLRCGLRSALLLTVIWYAVSCLMRGRPALPVLLFLTLPCGMIGGAAGVNTKLSLPHRRSHTAQRLPQKLILSRQAAKGIRRARARNHEQQQSQCRENQPEIC